MGDPKGFMKFKREGPVRRAVELRVLDWKELYEPFPEDKLKAQGAAMLAVIGGGAGLKEWLGLQLSHETVELLKVLLPTVLGLGFIGFVVWYVSEKIVGFKTLKMQAEIATDPMRHDLVIRKQ